MALHPITPGIDGVSGISVNGRPAEDAAALARELAAYAAEVPRPREGGGDEPAEFDPTEEQAEPEERTASEGDLCLYVADTLLDSNDPISVARALVIRTAIVGDIERLLYEMVALIVAQEAALSTSARDE